MSSRPGSAPPCPGRRGASAAAAGARVTTPTARATADAVAAAAAPTPCPFPQDGGQAELARRPACRLVLSIHDELLYEVGKGLCTRDQRCTTRAFVECTFVTTLMMMRFALLCRSFRCLTELLWYIQHFCGFTATTNAVTPRFTGQVRS